MRRLVSLSVVALVATAILSACGGDDSDLQDSPTSAPTQTIGISPSPTEGITASPVATQTKLTTEEALAELDALEKAVRNPDPAIVAQFDIIPSNLEDNQRKILEGIETSNVKIPGLNDVRTAIENGDKARAKDDLARVLDSSLGGIGTVQGPSDLVFITEDELDGADPDQVFLKPEFIGVPASAVWKSIKIEMIEFWYGL